MNPTQSLTHERRRFSRWDAVVKFLSGLTGKDSEIRISHGKDEDWSVEVRDRVKKIQNKNRSSPGAGLHDLYW